MVKIFDVFLCSIGGDPNSACFLDHSIVLSLLLRQLIREFLCFELGCRAGCCDDRDLLLEFLLSSEGFGGVVGFELNVLLQLGDVVSCAGGLILELGRRVNICYQGRVNLQK